MKKVRIVITIILIGMIAIAWLSNISNTIAKTEEYNSYIKSAESNMESSLYQKAISDYENALSIKENESIRRELLKAYRLAYEDETIQDKKYVQALEAFCKEYPKKADIWEELIQLELNNGDYKDARNYYNKAVRAGAKSEKIDELKDIINYSFKSNGRIYTEIVQTLDGYSSVFNGKEWGVISPDGNWYYESNYVFTSPTGSKKPILVTNERDTRILNESGIVQAKTDDTVSYCRIINDGLVPIKDGEQWSFYNYKDKKFISDKYDDATCFEDGIAYVKQNNKWYLIDTSGKLNKDVVFDNIVFLSSGEFASNGVMVACRNGNYGLYTIDGKSFSDFSVPEMDVNMGGLIAFKGANGKWGFINAKGKTVIDPTYEKAKSFSGGLAAVLVNGKWGFINESNKLVIPNEYVDAGYFSSKGVCFVSESTGEFHMISLRFGDN